MLSMSFGCENKVGCNIFDLYSPMWDSGLGLICVLAIIFSCLFNIYCTWVNDSLIDRVYYWLMLLTSVAALMQYSNPSNPKVIFQTYLILIASRSILHIISRFSDRFSTRIHKTQ